MTPDDFTAWLARIIASGLADDQRGVCELLGVTENTITAYKRRGGPKILALACQAITNRLTICA